MNENGTPSGDVEQMVEWYTRECRGEDCDEKMEDLSRRVYCNDCFDARSDHAGREPEATEEAEQVLRESLGDRSVGAENEQSGGSA